MFIILIFNLLCLDVKISFFFMLIFTSDNITVNCYSFLSGKES